MISREEKNKKVVKEINREKTIKRSKIMLTVTFVTGILLILFYLYIRFIGTSFIKTNEYIIKNRNIPASFHGSKIVHLSDILYGSTINKKDLDYLKEEISLINPDIIIFTGDLIINNYSINQEEIEYLKDFFNNINAKLGKYAVNGDMDNSTFDLIMNDTNFILLNNESVKVYNKANEPIIIIGLNSNNPKTLSNNSNNDNDFIISLIHNYDYYSNFNMISDVVFAGHNLGGEIRMPYKNGLLGDNEHNENYYKLQNSEIYISNGLGSIHKMRLFNHPSINVYRLYNN